MKRVVMSTMMGALLLGSVSSVLAQNEVNQRQRNQQKRIGKGVENGSLRVDLVMNRGLLLFQVRCLTRRVPRCLCKLKPSL